MILTKRINALYCPKVVDIEGLTASAKRSGIPILASLAHDDKEEARSSKGAKKVPAKWDADF